MNHLSRLILDELAKSQEMVFPVIPAKAGIQGKQTLLDPGFRRGDGLDDFLWSVESREAPSCAAFAFTGSYGHYRV
jgi:hypothetical protein